MKTDLLTRLRQATADIHADLERHTLMQRMLAGGISRPDYCLYLRNLHPIYAALEAALARHALHPQLAGFDLPELSRAGALAEDLLLLCGDGWASLPVTPSAAAYARAVTALADDRPELLAAHAYVRYLGDLSGGRLVRGRVAGALGLDTGAGLAFYTFGEPDSASLLAQHLRRALKSLPVTEVLAGALVDEAVRGFDRHRHLFDDLEGLATVPQSPAVN